MIPLLRWIGQLGFHVGMVILVVMLMFTTSFSALRLTETPTPMQHYKVGKEMWQKPTPPERALPVGPDPWSINQGPSPSRPVIRSDRSSPLRL